SRRRHTRFSRDWSSDVCSSDLIVAYLLANDADPFCWRLMSLVGVIPSIVLFVGMFFLPETPRWLISKGYEKKGKRILEKFEDPRSEERRVGRECGTRVW